MRRRKTIEMDGATIVISPLTLGQVGAMGDNGEVTPIQKTVYDLVCEGLNNAQLDEDDNPLPGATPWTPDRVKAKLDLVLWKHLHSEILTFSGLKIEAPPVGETPAPAPLAA